MRPPLKGSRSYFRGSLTDSDDARVVECGVARIAQEVHDAQGHQLSLLTLHARALDMTSGDKPRVAELVRANAQPSMADLRSLLAILHHPNSTDIAAVVPRLDDVPALIDETGSTRGEHRLDGAARGDGASR